MTTPEQRRPLAGTLRAHGLVLLLLGATLGEGGGHPASLVAWHAGLVTLLVWALLAGDDGVHARAPARPPLVALGVFVLLFGLGVSRAPYTYAALLVAIELGCCLGVVWLATRDSPRLLHRMITPLQIGGALQGAWVLVQWLAGDAVRPAGTFLNPNHMSLWLVAVTLVAAGASRPADPAIVLWRRALLAAPAVGAVVLAGSRGAVVAIVAGTAWLAWTHRRRTPLPVRVAVAAVVLVVLGGLAVRQGVRVDRYDPFRYHRVKIWMASARAAAVDPWWGTGPGQFPTAAAALRFPDGDGPLRYDRAFSVTHSDLLRLPAEFGAPAALAALVGVGLAAIRVAARRRRGSLDPAAEGAVAALIAIGAQATVDNPTSWPSVYLLASALAGVVLSEERPSGAVRVRSVRAAAAGALVLFFLVADAAPFAAWRATRDLPHGALEPGALARLERAKRWNPLHPEYPLRLAEHLSGGGVPWDLDAYAAAREAAEHATRLHPHAARYRRGVAQVEAHACRTLFPDVACRDRAVRGYLAAERLAPHDPFLPAARAAFLLDTGDPDGARRAAERALAIEPEAVLPRLLLADAFLAAGTEADRRRAETLIADARDRAARWSGWREGSYGLELLRPDPRIFDRLERKLGRGGATQP